ncbi:MAG TPA: hypothetical protein VNZ58_15215, partial [Thermomicrobiales bacterium]|nr:hypothetical protein [Thermomicrobiales bacterium]
MEPQELWASLHRIYEMEPRERYSSTEVDRLHRRCVRQVEAMTYSERRLSLSRYVRDVMLSEDALEQDR